MQRIGYAWLIAALFASTVSSAQSAPAQSAPAHTRSLQLSRVDFNPDSSATTQRVKVGTICLFSGPALNFGTSTRTLNSDRYERLFSETMAARHFNIVSRSASLFEGEGNASRAEFLIGGTVRVRSVDICDSYSGIKGSIVLSVEWQIYDRSRQQIVETVTTEGTGRVPTFSQNGLEEIFSQAFSSSLNALIDRNVIQQHVGNPAP
jgi:hypothetical protein